MNTKTLAPLGCLALVLALVYLGFKEPNLVKNARQPAESHGTAASKSLDTTTISQQPPGTRPAAALSPGKYNVSDDVVLKTANDSIARLKIPLGKLFEKWGLDNAALEDVLDALHEKQVVHLRSRFNSSAGITQKLSAKEAAQRGAEAEARIAAIVGGPDRLYEMSRVMAQSNMAKYEADAPKRQEQNQWLASRLTKEIDELKEKHGADYEREFRRKYGDEDATTLLKMMKRAGK